jgi:DNA-binding XRE family transcriptional regulator
MIGHFMFSAAELRPFKFASPSGLGHLYAIAFDSGMVKVGRSETVQARVTTHVAAAAKHGASPLVAWISKPHVNTANNETRLVAFCAQNAENRLSAEYFTGLDFTNVVEHAETLPFHESRQEWLAAVQVFTTGKTVTQQQPLTGDTSESVFDEDALRWLMTINGIGVQALAELIGVDRATLFRLRRGGGNPTFNVVAALARVLRVPIDTFVKEPVGETSVEDFLSTA